ncbi:hypothetical protein [Agrobacterium salinitolerans]|uniref:hypothetical protein n=1 Tax=Agrobacterium salinitolerans TaxID=1183413 RepID=UPI001FCD4431|nr:hypothetical protein [Agrobacterium salinitolerans]
MDINARSGGHRLHPKKRGVEYQRSDVSFRQEKCPGGFVLGDKTDSDNALGYYMWSISDNRLIMDAVTAECHGFSEPVASRGVTIEAILERIDVEMRDQVAQAIFESITTGVFLTSVTRSICRTDRTGGSWRRAGRFLMPTIRRFWALAAFGILP